MVIFKKNLSLFYELMFTYLDWHKAVLTFFGISFICSIAAFCFTLCAACIRVCAVASNVLHFSACKFLKKKIKFFLKINSIIN